VVLCKTCEAITGEVDMCCFPIFMFVKLRDSVRNIGLCSLFGLRDLCYKCKQELEFL
jgi:hypothetical protein